MVTEGFKHKLTAVFSTDIVGNCRLMGEDEVATAKTLKDYKGVIFTLIKQHRGRVIAPLESICWLISYSEFREQTSAQQEFG